MFCTACGTALPDSAKFCSRCGAVQSGPLAAAAPAPRYEPARPAATFPPAPTTYPAPTYAQTVDKPARYGSPAGLAVWVTLFLIMGMAADLGSIVSNLLQASLLQEVQSGVELSRETMESNDARQALFGLTQVGVYFTTAVLFLVWISRCYRNLEALSRWRLQFGSGWVVGAWFVPFLNLVRPYKIVRETLWVSTHPDLADDVGAGYTPPGTALLVFWWTAYLIMGFLGQIVFRLTLSAKAVGELLTVSYIGAVADLESIVAAILAAAVVGVISSRQQAAARARGVLAAA
jgi:hypothetical protein